MTITADNLRKVAEYMGLSPYINTEGKVFLGSPMFGGNRYNPLQNSDQDAELEIKFRINTNIDDDTGLWEAWIYFNDESESGLEDIAAIGKTPAEARTLAAIAYVEGLDNE